MPHPHLPKHIHSALSTPHPPPFTPFWTGAALPKIALPPTTSSYLFPLKLKFTYLPVYPRIFNAIYCIHYSPFPVGQKILGSLLNVRYWTVRKSYEERGKRSEQIAARTEGGGGGLWWNANTPLKNSKAVVRSKLARKMRRAFRGALSEAGFDNSGLRVPASEGSSSTSLNQKLQAGNLIGSLRLNATTETLDASFADLEVVCRQVVGHLQYIRLHHQRGTVKNTSRRDVKIVEQTWQEAKISLVNIMESRLTHSQLQRDDFRGVANYPDFGASLEEELVAPNEDDLYITSETI